MVKHEQFKAFYSLLVRMESQEAADKLFVLFNGRYFSEDNKETIHAIFISSLFYFNQVQSCVKPPELSTLHADYLHLFLPSCPVCLERLDVSITGLSTNLFYKPQLQDNQWPNIPIDCQICEIESYKTSENSPEKKNKYACCNCDTKEELWICMICSEINCGRY